MRTSRISRETAKLVDALSPSKRNAVAHRRPLTRFANSANGLDGSKVNSTDDEMPAPSEVTVDKTSSLGKRKRGSRAAPATTNLTVESTTVRKSPRKAAKQEEQLDDARDDDITAPRRKAKRQPAKRITGPNGVVQVKPPLDWEQVYSITASMRKRVLAPVDTMGCESLAEENRSPVDQRLQTLVSLMLSSQTKDTVTAAAMRNLQANMTGGFCLDSLLQISEIDLNTLIEKVGFHNTKAKHIKRTADILRDKFGGDIPDTIDGLISLPGVGPKMAYLCMSAAWGRDEGIGVDVHVHRITNLWGWHKTSTPEQTREMLESWLPREKWHDINHLLVGFGQTICLPVGRRCGECDLATEKLCPSAVSSSPKKRRVKRETEVDVGSGLVLNEQEVKFEADDIGIKVEADMEGAGKIEMQAAAGTNDAVVADIEGLDVGSVVKL